MKFNVAFPMSFNRLKHGDKVIQLGSCFSTNMSEKLRLAGFDVLDNPFGVIFHPLALTDFILDSLGEKKPEFTVLREDIWLNYMASSSIYGMSEFELKNKSEIAQINFVNRLKEAKLLTITFGSAHGYRLKENGKLVANCHQQPIQLFEKECTELAVMLERWKEVVSILRMVNPELQLVFTVSPVRYIRDGWVENNQSKARLLMLTEELTKDETALYFPSYEIIVDELRDYRYFEIDGVHPNQLAIDHVWMRLREVLFNEQTDIVINELLHLRAMENHRLLFPESVTAERFKKSFQEKRESFLSLYPVVVW